MPNLDQVSRSETRAAAPTAADLKPPPLQYTAQQASPAAAIDSVQADAAKGNMMANMHGGWVPDKRGIVHIVTKPSRSNKKRSRSRSMSRSMSRSRSRSRTIRRGGKRGRKFRKQGSSFKHRVSRRIRMRLLERHIKKHSIGSNSMMQKMMRGGNNEVAADAAPVPQHGRSCSGNTDPNCPGLAAESLLTASRQSTVNAHGD